MPNSHGAVGISCVVHSPHAKLLVRNYDCVSPGMSWATLFVSESTLFCHQLHKGQHIPLCDLSKMIGQNPGLFCNLVGQPSSLTHSWLWSPSCQSPS